ncbi:MAG: MerR family transcriptional regulator [Desulfopila sp.]
MQFNIPDKLYFKIGEVAQLAQVAPHVLRYWETEFKQIKPKRASSKQRLYRREDVQIILQIRTLLHERGYTIAGAKKLLEAGTDARPAPSEKTQAVSAGSMPIAEVLAAIKKELRQLRQLLDKKR